MPQVDLFLLQTPLEFYRETGIKPEDTRRHRLSSLDEINMVRCQVSTVC